MFNFKKVNKNIIKSIGILSNVSEAYEEFLINPTDENGEKLLNLILSNDSVLDEMKEYIADTINKVNGDDEKEEIEINVEPKENGFLIE